MVYKIQQPNVLLRVVRMSTCQQLVQKIRVMSADFMLLKVFVVKLLPVFAQWLLLVKQLVEFRFRHQVGGKIHL